VLVWFVCVTDLQTSGSHLSTTVETEVDDNTQTQSDHEVGTSSTASIDERRKEETRSFSDVVILIS